jgi:hypothetical protein
MADVWATKNGVWSDVTVWNTGALPTTADDVYADSRTVYVDINAQVLSVRNGLRSGGTRGGTFIGNNNISLSADVFTDNSTGGCVTFLSAAPSIFTIYGNVRGSDITSNGIGLRNTSSGLVTIFGNVSGGIASGTTYGVENASTGTVSVIGNAIAINVLNGAAIYNTSSGTINLTGNVFGGTTGSGNRGITNFSSGSVNILGNVLAGTTSNSRGIESSVSSGGRVTIVGDVSGTAGALGVFMPVGTYSQTGNVYGILGGALSFTTTSATIVGNIFGGAGVGVTLGGGGVVNVIGNIRGGTASAATGLSNTSTGTVNVTGTSTAGTGTNTHGLANGSTGVINLFGDAYGGSSGTIGGVANAGAGTCNIIGNAYSGTPGSSSHGIINTNASTGVINLTGNAYANFATAILNGSGPSTININGSVFGGSVANAFGVVNGSPTGAVVVTGSAVGGTVSTAYGAVNNTTGILRVKRAVGNNWGLGFTTVLAGTPGVFSNAQGSRTFVEELECGPRGQWPTGGVIFFTPNSKATSQFVTDTFQNYSLIQSNSADNLQPPVSSVRQGTTYNLGLSTGTCAIPPASSVGFGVPVDNTTGTATLVSTNVWNISASQITDSQSIGGRLKNTLTANAAERLVNSFNLN